MIYIYIILFNFQYFYYCESVIAIFQYNNFSFFKRFTSRTIIKVI